MSHCPWHTSPRKCSSTRERKNDDASRDSCAPFSTLNRANILTRALSKSWGKGTLAKKPYVATTLENSRFFQYPINEWEGIARLPLTFSLFLDEPFTIHVESLLVAPKLVAPLKRIARKVEGLLRRIQQQQQQQPTTAGHTLHAILAMTRNANETRNSSWLLLLVSLFRSRFSCKHATILELPFERG